MKYTEGCTIVPFGPDNVVSALCLMDLLEPLQTFLAVTLQLSVHERATVSTKDNTCFHTWVDPNHMSGWLNHRTFLQFLARPFLEIAVIVRFPQIEHADFDTVVVLELPNWVP